MRPLFCLLVLVAISCASMARQHHRRRTGYFNLAVSPKTPVYKIIDLFKNIFTNSKMKKLGEIFATAADTVKENQDSIALMIKNNGGSGALSGPQKASLDRLGQRYQELFVKSIPLLSESGVVNELFLKNEEKMQALTLQMDRIVDEQKTFIAFFNVEMSNRILKSVWSLRATISQDLQTLKADLLSALRSSFKDVTTQASFANACSLIEGLDSAITMPDGTVEEDKEGIAKKFTEFWCGHNIAGTLNVLDVLIERLTRHGNPPNDQVARSKFFADIAPDSAKLRELYATLVPQCKMYDLQEFGAHSPEAAEEVCSHVKQVLKQFQKLHETYPGWAMDSALAEKEDAFDECVKGLDYNLFSVDSDSYVSTNEFVAIICTPAYFNKYISDLVALAENQKRIRNRLAKDSQEVHLLMEKERRAAEVETQKEQVEAETICDCSLCSDDCTASKKAQAHHEKGTEKCSYGYTGRELISKWCPSHCTVYGGTCRKAWLGCKVDTDCAYSSGSAACYCDGPGCRGIVDGKFAQVDNSHLTLNDKQRSKITSWSKFSEVNARCYYYFLSGCYCDNSRAILQAYDALIEENLERQAKL